MRRSIKHKFVYQPYTAIGDAEYYDTRHQRKGNYGINPGGWVAKTIDVCVCTQCDTRVMTNTPTQARAVANALGLDCSTLVCRQVLES